MLCQWCFFVSTALDNGSYRRCSIMLVCFSSSKWNMCSTRICKDVHEISLLQISARECSIKRQDFARAWPSRMKIRNKPFRFDMRSPARRIRWSVGRSLVCSEEKKHGSHIFPFHRRHYLRVCPWETIDNSNEPKDQNWPTSERASDGEWLIHRQTQENKEVQSMKMKLSNWSKRSWLMLFRAVDFIFVFRRQAEWQLCDGCKSPKNCHQQHCLEQCEVLIRSMIARGTYREKAKARERTITSNSRARKNICITWSSCRLVPRQTHLLIEFFSPSSEKNECLSHLNIFQ